MLIKIWFSLISIIQLAALFFLLLNFNLLNPLHWISLFVLILTIALTAIIYLEQRNKKQNKNKEKNLEKIYSEFLKQKDKQIEELQKKNSLMFKTAMKRSESELQLAELKRKWEEKMKDNDSS